MPTLDYTAAIPGWGGSWSASVSLRYTTAYDAASDSSTITVQALSLGYYGRKGYGTSSETVLTLKAADSGESRSLTLRCSDTSNGGVKTFTAEGCPTALSVRHSGGSGERRVQLSAQSSILVYPTENGGSRYTASGSGSVSLSTGSVAPPPEPPAPPEPPRPSSLVSWPASVATQGTLSLTVSRSSPAYYHKATLRCGSAVLYSSAAFATTLSLTVPRSWFDAYPNSTSLSCTLSVQTYTDSGCGTPVGSPATASLSVTADSGMKPVINSGFLAAAALNAGTAAAGISGYVQGYSKARLTLSRGKLSMANKATVSSYKLSCQGRSRTLSAPGATATMDTDTLTGSSAVTVTVTVTDSRGRTASTSLSVTPMAYARPRLSAISAYRCDSAGRSDEGGAWYYARATGSISALGGQNSLTLQVQSARGSGSFGAAETLSSGAGRVLGGALEPDSGYRLRFTASDALGNSVSVIRELPTRVWAMKFRPDGKGVAFGKAAEYGKALELPADWELRFGAAAWWERVFPPGAVVLGACPPVGVWTEIPGGLAGQSAWTRNESEE